MNQIIRNPFDAGGYSLAEMTQAINILPNMYTRLGQMGLFRFEGVSQRTVIIESLKGVLTMLPTVQWGGPATVGGGEDREMRAFVIPHIPHDDRLMPSDLQGQPGLGQSVLDTQAAKMMRKLETMRKKHAQTREYMEINALRGILKDGAGVTLQNYFTAFGLTQQSVDFALGTAGTNVQSKCRSVTAYMEDNLLGETMTSAIALSSPEFMDKLLNHAKVEDAYKFYESKNGGDPLRENVTRMFPFQGILFSEYRGTVTLHSGATERLIPAGEAVCFPMGTTDTFVTYGAPADLLETVNTIGEPIYAYQHLDPKGRWIDISTQSNILPLNKRPQLTVRLYSSN